MPITLRASAPAPDAVSSGTTPRMKAKAVIRIGRSRSFAADSAASIEALALLVLHLGELDDENRVLRRQADEHDEPDLREHVVHVALAHEPAREPEPEIRAEGRERRAEQDAERHPPALVLRGQHQEDEEDREREHHGDARRAALLVRQVGPVEAHVRRQHLFRGGFQRVERLRRRKAGRGHAGELRRAEQVEAVGELRSRGGPRGDQRVERDHAARAGSGRRRARAASGPSGTPARPAGTPCRRGRTC